MKKGDIVTIYSDPRTKQRPEGEAKLLKFHFVNRNFAHWKVKFLEDGFACDRFIFEEV